MPVAEARSERCILFINESAGSLPTARERLNALTKSLQDAPLHTEVHWVKAGQLRSAVKSRLDNQPTLVVIAGGDGSVSSAAGAIAHSKHTLGVLPLGTMNRFARQLGISMNLEEAAQTLIDGDDLSIDLGEVNGEVFLNTCVLGLYPEMAQAREWRRARHPHWPRWLRWSVDSLSGAKQAWHARHLPRFHIRVGRNIIARQSPLLLITNNPLPVRGQQRSFDKGVLSIYIPRARSKLELVRVALSAAISGPEESPMLDQIETARAVLETSRQVPVALDGEVRDVTSPLYLKCLPLACRVRAPAKDG